MRVLHLSTFDESGGAARAATRLHTGLKAIGIDSQMLVQFKGGDSRDVIGARTPVGRMLRDFRPHLDALPVRFYPNKPVASFSPALLPDNLVRRVNEIDPDIVHLHWLAAGFVRLETLRRFNRPLIWTLHDSWAFTGGCHVPGDCVKYRQRCGACPVLGSPHDHDLSRWIWRRKQKAWRDLPLTAVAPSTWLAGSAGTSSLFRDKQILAIPNGLDLQRYKPIDQRIARDLLGLPQDKKLILFGAKSGTLDRNKGFHLLAPALGTLAGMGWSDRAELLVFGSSGPDEPLASGMKTSYMGHLHDDISLALLYAAADLFVFPSIQEALGYTAMESMACGTPCVAFDQGGVPDLIDHEHNGYLARPFETDDLARGIAWILEDEERRQMLSRQARQKIVENFDFVAVAARYLDLYRTMTTS